MIRLNAWSSRERQDHCTIVLHGRVDRKDVVTEPIVQIAGDVVTTRDGQVYELGRHLFGPHRNALGLKSIEEYLEAHPS